MSTKPLNSNLSHNAKYWLIVIACCGLAASSIGICSNSVGVFYSPVSKALGVGRGSFALHATLGNLTAGFFGPVTAKLMKKYSLRVLMAVGIIMAAVSTALMAAADNIILFYILAIIRGVGVSFFALMPVTTIIGNWFEEKQGLAMGIALSFSGLSGAIFNPITAAIIEGSGWRTAYIVSAIFIAALALPGALLVVRLKPSESGLLPYGAISERESPGPKIVNKKINYFSVIFILMGVFTVLVTSVTGIAQHFSGYAESIGLGAQVGATMVSAGMVGNIVSKLVIGVISDKFGCKTACISMVAVNGLALSCLVFAPKDIPAIALVAAFFYGSVYSICAVGVPLLTRKMYGTERYSSAYSVINILTGIGSACSLSIIGFLYDISGTYSLALNAGIVIDIVCIVIVVLIFMISKRRADTEN